MQKYYLCTIISLSLLFLSGQALEAKPASDSFELKYNTAMEADVLLYEMYQLANIDEELKDPDTKWPLFCRDIVSNDLGIKFGGPSIDYAILVAIKKLPTKDIKTGTKWKNDFSFAPTLFGKVHWYLTYQCEEMIADENSIIAKISFVVKSKETKNISILFKNMDIKGYYEFDISNGFVKELRGHIQYNSGIDIKNPTAKTKHESSIVAFKYQQKAKLDDKIVTLMIDEAIRECVDALAKNQDDDGYLGDAHWKDGHAMGSCSLSLLALLKSGVSRESKVVQQALTYLRPLKMLNTYDIGLLCMALEAYYTPLGELKNTENIKEDSLKKEPRKLEPADKKWMEKAAQWLVVNQSKPGAWTYVATGGSSGRNSRAFDNSNAQYGVLGLYAAARCGIFVQPKTWKTILEHWLDCQCVKAERYKPTFPPDSADKSAAAIRVRGWDYTTGKSNSASVSMTCAGTASVAIAYACLYQVHRKFAKKYRKKVIASIGSGLGWLEKNYCVSQSAKMGSYYYSMYGLERACVINAVKYLGKYNWYREGAIQLCCQKESAESSIMGIVVPMGEGKQTKERFGRWGTAKKTSFTLLFLKRASAPLYAVSER